MKEILKLEDPNDQKKIVDNFNLGMVGLFPTDTVYGICCRIDNINSIKKIFDIKKRDISKPFLVLCDDFDSAKKYIIDDLNNQKKEIIQNFWPGPLTIIFNANVKNSDSIVRAGRDTLAVRVPDNKDITNIIKGVGVPLVAPSANISGQLAPANLNEVSSEIIDAVDFIVDGECTIKSPSTIIDITKNGIEIVRAGNVKL